jgi:hypothetical protein
MKRETNKQKAEKLAEANAIQTRYLTVEGVSAYTSFSAKLLVNLRSLTPNKRDIEQTRKEMAGGKITVGPTFIEAGKVRLYDIRDVDFWMSLFPKRGVFIAMGE